MQKSKRYSLPRDPSFTIVVEESTPEYLIIRDIGPWDQHRTVTNAAEETVEILVEQGHLPKGRKLYYYDTENNLDELLIDEDGQFAGYSAGGPPRPQRTTQESINDEIYSLLNDDNVGLDKILNAIVAGMDKRLEDSQADQSFGDIDFQRRREENIRQMEEMFGTIKKMNPSPWKD
jgi:hypothetical protein